MLTSRMTGEMQGQEVTGPGPRPALAQVLTLRPTPDRRSHSFDFK